MRSKTPAVRIRSNNNSSNNRTTRRSPTRRRSNISNDNNNSNSTDHRSNMIRSTTTTATSSATSSASASASAPTASPSSSSSSSSTPPINLSEEEVLFKGLECIHFGKRRQLKVQAKRNIERFRGNYGVSPSAISKLIRDLQTVLVEEHQIKNFNIDYLFLTLHWFKAYPTYIQLEGPWDVCPEKIGEYIKLYARAIQRLKEHKIKWFSEEEIDDEDIFLVSVDGIHCRTYEVRRDPGKKWYSHKSHGAGFAYELAIAIRRDRLVWMNGPFCASKPDITIFRFGGGDENNPGPNLRDKIPEGKRAVADSGYKGEDGKTCSITRQSDSKEMKEFKARAKSRQEVFNSKVKAFTCTATEFRHGQEVHAMAFESVCILLQYDMESGHGLFEV